MEQVRDGGQGDGGLDSHPRRGHPDEVPRCYARVSTLRRSAVLAGSKRQMISRPILAGQLGGGTTRDGRCPWVHGEDPLQLARPGESKFRTSRYNASPNTMKSC